MFDKTVDNLREWETFMKKNKVELNEKLTQLLPEIENAMQNCSIDQLGIYFPPANILSPRFQDFLIICFFKGVQGPEHEALILDFKNHMFTLLAQQFHYWIGTEQELAMQAEHFLSQSANQRAEIFPDILNNMQTLHEFLKQQ